MTTFAGFGYDFAEKNTFDDTEEHREAFFEELWLEVSYAERSCPERVRLHNRCRMASSSGSPHTRTTSSTERLTTRHTSSG
jgi:hypothetical protein